MIYFDNAATTKYKPEVVYEATNFYLREVGVSPGRGSYGMGIEASRMLYEAIGTVSTGTVRLSLNYMNTEQEIDTVLDILRNVGE